MIVQCRWGGGAGPRPPGGGFERRRLERYVCYDGGFRHLSGWVENVGVGHDEAGVAAMFVRARRSVVRTIKAKPPSIY